MTVRRNSRSSSRPPVQHLLNLAASLVVAACSSSNGAAPTQGDAGDAGDAQAVATSESNANCQATIAQGGLTGKLAGATCEYLGIPYGKPPVGPLRFMPPQPAAGWGSSPPRDATSFGKSCLQASSTLGSVGPTSEDCLSVNVFTPQAAASGPLPVMAFIYGGAFTSGSSSLYDARPMSEAGPVVVVTMNYRLGALGFLALPELDSLRTGAPSGSDGIRDQQLALKWVQDNIATFHGDRNNVTVFGESAGSMSTCMHIVSPGSQGLANRYIMESGSCVGKAPLLSTEAQAYQVGAELAASFCGGGDAGATDGAAGEAGSSGGDASDLIACLQAADPMKLVTWFPAPGSPQTGLTALLGNLLGPPFAPTVEGRQGGVLPDLPANLIASGQFNKDAAILAGTNRNEWGLFVDLAALGGSGMSSLNVMTSAQLNQGIAQVFGSMAAEVEAQYPSTDATAPQVFIDLVTDYAFRCPTRDLARATMAQGTKAYYLYSYEIGKAWHSFELVPLFNLSALSALGATTPSAAFTAEMLGYWTQFAKAGDPNGHAGATSPAWPAYASASDEYLELLDPTPMATANLEKTQCDFWASFTPATQTAPPGDGGTD